MQPGKTRKVSKDSTRKCIFNMDNVKLHLILLNFTLYKKKVMFEFHLFRSLPKTNTLRKYYIEILVDVRKNNFLYF